MEMKGERERDKTNIAVIGVGNGGVNAVNRMATVGLEGVKLIAIDTDSQVLSISKAHKILQIGQELTGGLSTGGDLQIGKRAAEGAKDEFEDLLRDADMVFIAAGMGGGTGTGASPLIAEVAMELGILTVGIVTKPFSFEGPVRAERAKKGIEKLKEKVDALITISNDRLLKVAPKEISIAKAFGLVDDVLLQGVQGISDLVTARGMINLNFADVKNAIKGAGNAMIGIGEGKGDRKIREAVEGAVSSPLLEMGSIKSAMKVIMNITGGEDLSLKGINEAATLIQKFTSEEAEIAFGAVIKEELKGRARITVIATGFQEIEKEQELPEEVKIRPKRKRKRKREEDLDIPTFMRRGEGIEEGSKKEQ